MVISIIADSLAMPRVDEKNRVYYSATWPVLMQLKSRCCEGEPWSIAISAQRARDSRSLNRSDTFSETIKFIDPTLIILEVGIVDCAPRIISEKEKRHLNRFFVPSFIRNKIIEQRKKNRETQQPESSLKKVYVKPEDFKKNILTFKKKVIQSGNRKLLIIPILGYILQLDKVHPGYKSNIELYNEILISLQDNFLQVLSIQDKMNHQSFYCTDGYHLNEDGHQFLANEIEKVIIF